MHAHSVADLLQYGRSLQATIHTDLEDILTGLQSLLPKADTRLTSAVALLNESLCEVLDLAQERMRAAEQVRDKGCRQNKHAIDQRDDARRELRNRLILLRQWLDGLYGQAGLDLFYIMAKTPENPGILVSYAKSVLQGLLDPALVLPKASMPMPFDRQAWAAELRLLMERLEQANVHLAYEQSGVTTTQMFRRIELDKLQQLTRAVAHLLKGLFLLADKPQRIKSLRRERRKRSKTRTLEATNLSEDRVEPAPLAALAPLPSHNPIPVEQAEIRPQLQASTRMIWPGSEPLRLSLAEACPRSLPLMAFKGQAPQVSSCHLVRDG